jgi:hypothetical protein
MTRLHGFVAGVLLAQALVATPLAAQTLSDVAKKEEERRKGVTTSGKTYTNGNLKVEPPPSTLPPAPLAATVPLAAATPAPSQGSPENPQPATGPEGAAATDDKKSEAYWKKRMQDHRTALDRAQTFSDALQSRVNALTGDYARRDDPAQRNVIAAERQKALSELERVKKEILTHTKVIADAQEEARRAGVPAGWVR